MVGLKGVLYAGNHGLEIETGGAKRLEAMQRQGIGFVGRPGKAIKAGYFQRRREVDEKAFGTLNLLT